MDKLEGLLFRLGIYKCQEGYDCIWTAMELVEEDETLLRRLMGGLYAATAARCGNTRTRVERNIRSSIAKAWEANPSISRKSPIERLHSRLRQETFFVCCTSICGSKRWKSKHVRRKRLARVCLKTGLGQPRQGAARFRGKGRHRLAAGPSCGAVSGLVRGGLENGRNLPCVPGYLAL